MEEEVIEELPKKFEDYEDIIKKAVTKHLKESWIIEENLILVQWIGSIPINKEISNNMQLWKFLPVITVVWENSWRVYFFSLKLLLPELFDDQWKVKK